MTDIVINHRNANAWGVADFVSPAFSDDHAFVVCNDECHCGMEAPDTREGNISSRDPDHTNASVQAEVKKWETG